MGTVDVSREGTDFRKRYKGVRLQQGRLLTDDDFNDAQRIDAESIRRTHLDVIGPVGSPDGGFLPVVPSAPLPAGSKVQFTITAGTLYVGGLRLEQRVAEAFDLQKDWLNFDPANPAHQPLLPTAGTRTDLVWIEAWEQPVSAVEDGEKFEVALGSADTAVNVRAIQRVAVFPGVNADECPAAWAQATASPEWKALGTMAPDMELATQARLQVQFTAPAVPADLCSPAVAGGYLGAENQAIRVQMVSANTYTWGYDNASPLYRVQVAQVIKNGVSVTQVKLLTEPKDALHWPLKGQVIEILPWSAALPNGETLAELNGLLARVTATYNPDDQTLEIDTPLPAGFGKQWTGRSDKADFFDGTAEDDYFFLRVWNRGDDITSPAEIPIANGKLGNTGLSVTFVGGPLRPCDHWIIAARPAAPDVVTPWLLEAVNGAPPAGLKRYRAPLALIRWTVTGGIVTGAVIDDCRPPFLPLTKLRGCCTVTVGDDTTSFGQYSSIQKAIDALPQSGGTVCVLPGTYDECVVVANRANIVIHGCDARCRVRAGLLHDKEAPAFLVVDSQDVAIERLGIESGPRSAVEILRSQRVAVRECVIQMRDLPTLYQAIFARGEDLVIERNLIDNLAKPTIILSGGAGVSVELKGPADGVSPPPPPVLAEATRGGIQLGGGSQRVRVLDNVIRGGIWNGITLGSVRLVGGDDVDQPDKPATLDPCFPCKPVDVTEDEDEPKLQVVSAGDLYDVEIRGNAIEDMGASGIAVVRFFNLAKQKILVGVRGLHIESNRIRRCLRRPVAPPSQAMQWMVAYGGICLARVVDLRVFDNEITRTGVDHLEPVCGVFALLAENVAVDRNRILDDRPRSEEPPENAKVGMRGGIWIWIALAGSTPRKEAPGMRRFDGVHAAALRDNLVVAPVGRAVTLFCAGPLVIARNRLVSHGTTGRDLEVLATSVLVGNVGISNEWTAGLLLAMLWLTVGSGLLPGNVTPCDVTTTLGLHDSNGNLLPPLTAYWPSGKSLFAENQVTTDVIGQGSGLHASSIAILSLDDLGFTDNECEVESVRRWFLADALLVAGSVRLADNRLSETWLRAILSAWTLGLMNTTTDNQATHCLRANAALGNNMRVFRDNLMFITDTCPNACGHFGAQQP